MARNRLQCEFIEPRRAGLNPAPSQQVGWLGFIRAEIQCEHFQTFQPGLTKINAHRM